MCMIKSMTGYGKAEALSAMGKLMVEIRAVNHRYGEINVKLPRLFFPFEGEVKKKVAERMKRGKIDVFVQFEQSAGAGLQLEPDLSLARMYYDALDSIRSSLNMSDPVPLSLVVSQKDVLVARENPVAADNLGEELSAVVEAAVNDIEAMRVREGAALAHDVMERRSLLSGLIGQVAERAPAVVAELAQKLRERVRQLAAEVQLEDARLAQEVAILADKGDITEELVRFDSHLQQFDDILKLQEPVGRKLDFLMQEFNREINTIGSKANDSEIAALVVQVKTELERIREQIQNIE